MTAPESARCSRRTQRGIGSAAGPGPTPEAAAPGSAARRRLPPLDPHQEGDVPRVDALVVAERAARAAPQGADEPAQLVHDQVLRDLLVIEPEGGLQVLLVAEVAERAVTDVVQQAGKAHRLFDDGQRRCRRLHLDERRVDVLGQLPGEVHHAQAVREAAVLGRREDPPRALQLVDALESLHPRAVDDVRLGDLSGSRQRDAQVAVQGVGDEVDVVVGELHARARASLAASARRRS